METKYNTAEELIIFENMAQAGQERSGIYKVEKDNLSYEERKRKIEAFTYELLERAEEEELSLNELQKVAERITRYVEIAEYNIKDNTKFNVPGCYLWQLLQRKN